MYQFFMSGNRLVDIIGDSMQMFVKLSSSAPFMWNVLHLLHVAHKMVFDMVPIFSLNQGSGLQLNETCLIRVFIG